MCVLPMWLVVTNSGSHPGGQGSISGMGIFSRVSIMHEGGQTDWPGGVECECTSITVRND